MLPGHTHPGDVFRLVCVALRRHCIGWAGERLLQAELAGKCRATANGLLASRNRLGAPGGAVAIDTPLTEEGGTSASSW